MRLAIALGSAIVGGAAMPYLRGWARYWALRRFASSPRAPQNAREMEGAIARLLLLMTTVDVPSFALCLMPWLPEQ